MCLKIISGELPKSSLLYLPEELIVEKSDLVLGPVILELRHLVVELSKRVTSNQ